VIGKIVSHYQILEKLGEGGMGVVYKAQDTSLNRFVALKFLPPHLTKDESTRKRFIVEAQSASSLDHPNICNIHEINETPDGQLYICMAYYEGESLREKIDNGPIPPDVALKLFYKIVQGLKSAHEKNIIHRDIKPGNILITDKGEVKIIDFGLAKLAGVDLTKTTSSKGTSAYMCPEQIRGHKVDHRCDIWALGIVLYEMLTARLPFEAEYPEPMMYAIVNEEPNPLSHHLDNVPESLQDIITKLLKKDPDERYQEMAEILYDFQTHFKIDDSDAIAVKPAFKKILQQRKIYAYFGIIVLLILIYSFRSYLLPQYPEGNKIAVIPAASVLDSTEQEWFSEGMTDELRIQLAQISGLRVTSGFSSMHYKGTAKTTPQIASELDVQYLVEPSYIKINNDVKIKAKLIDAVKDEYIWVKEFESELKNILGLQGRIAKEIASQIRVELTPQEEIRLSKKREVNPETYEMYMKGMFHLNKLTPDGITKGLSILQQAVENNPDEPLVYAGIAIAYMTIAHGSSYTPDMMKKAQTAALNALKLDKSLPDAHLALSMVQVFYQQEWKNAIKSIKRTLELNPNLAHAHYMYAYLLRIPGRFEEGYAEMIRAKQLDPLNPVYPSDLGWNYLAEGKIDQSIEESLNSLDLNPQFPQAYSILGQAFAAKEMYKQAIEAAQKAAELSIDWKWSLAYTHAIAGHKEKAREIASEIEKQNLAWNTWCLAVIYAALKDEDKVFHWLEQSYKKRHPFILWIGAGASIYFGPYQNAPRFKNLAQRLNMPE